MNKKSIQLFSILGTVTTVSITVIELSNVTFLIENKRIIYFSLVSIIIFSFLFFWYFQKKVQELQVAVIGTSNTGKSVFITILFDEIQRAREKNYEFLINDKPTIERVYHDIDLLSIGKWLVGTAPGLGTSYKGVLVKSRLTRRIYNLIVTDYSGEQFQDLMNEKTRSWSHNTKYFDYLKESEIVFLTINVGEINYYHNTMSDYLATINLLASFEKEKQIKRPFALLFLQSDRLGDDDEYLNEDQIKNRYSKLIEVCKRRCKSFNYFFVSAIGEDAKKFSHNDGDNPNYDKNVKLNPKNVIEPLFWGISKLKI